MMGKYYEEMYLSNSFVVRYLIQALIGDRMQI